MKLINSMVGRLGCLALFAAATMTAVATETENFGLQVLPAPGRDIVRLEIRAQMSGPVTGLTYKWISESGQCTPQETAWPGTTYVFVDDATTDHLSVGRHGNGTAPCKRCVGGQDKYQ